MKYMLDTNACIRYLRNSADSIGLRMLQNWNNEFVISSVSVYELFHGAARSTKPDEERQKIDDFLSRIKIVALDRYSAALAGEIRGELEAIGQPIGPYDVLIAAGAIVSGATLVTHNVSEFSRVPHLKYEDWEQP
jgi:tRNA(fMet)-specific endonuclease VapC